MIRTLLLPALRFSTGSPSVLYCCRPALVPGLCRSVQTKQSLRRNFPLVGRLRYVFEDLRPKIQQYFVESDTDGAPINRIDRSVIYQRAKKQVDTNAAAGLDNPRKLNRHQIYRRIFMNEVKTFEEIYPSIAVGSMLGTAVPDRYKMSFQAASSEKF
jgi:hypothetical protein